MLEKYIEQPDFSHVDITIPTEYRINKIKIDSWEESIHCDNGLFCGGTIHAKMYLHNEDMYLETLIDKKIEKLILDVYDKKDIKTHERTYYMPRLYHVEFLGYDIYGIYGYYEIFIDYQYETCKLT